MSEIAEYIEEFCCSEDKHDSWFFLFPDITFCPLLACSHTIRTPEICKLLSLESLIDHRILALLPNLLPNSDHCHTVIQILVSFMKFTIDL